MLQVCSAGDSLYSAPCWLEWENCLLSPSSKSLDVNINTPTALHFTAQGTRQSRVPWESGWSNKTLKGFNKAIWYLPQSLTQIYLHIIFSTKNRQPFLNNEQRRTQTHAYLAGICKNLQCPSLLVGGVADDVHLLTRHSKNVAVADFIGNLKRDSSKWVKEKDRELSSFYWQKGYGAFSISPSHVESVRE